jgi:hypothetical protein
MWAHSLSGQASNLLVDNYDSLPHGSGTGLTQMGRTFQNRARSSQRTYNLVAGSMPDIKQKATEGTADIPLEVWFYNNGSAGVETSFKVTFYKDAALTQVIGEAEIVPRASGIINGCSWGRDTDSASITWQGLPPGEYSFWAKIDSENDIPSETNEADNVAMGKVIVEP